MAHRALSTPAPANRQRTSVLIVALFCVLVPAQAQTYHVIYTFTGHADGNGPVGVVIDRAGNLYGTASQGGAVGGECGNYGCGTVFRLTYKNSWIFSLLYSFKGGDDGIYPVANVTLAPDGTLYGSTAGGGSGCLGSGCGTIFNLRPPATFCPSVQCPWTETALYRFNGDDGYYPRGQVLDGAGNLYGATAYGTGYGCGGLGCGTIFQLARSGNTWIESVLYSFNGANDGSFPSIPVVDAAGNVYGVTGYDGEFRCGNAFELLRSAHGWTLKILYSFNPQIGDGCQPDAGMILDPSGNLYGTTLGNVLGDGGVFELSPAANGNWTQSVLYLDPSGLQDSISPLIRDASGSLYGTTFSAPTGWGSVFKLTPTNGGWSYTTLHTFTCSDGDGAGPGPLAIDAQGNLYGTASYCGEHNAGLVFEITS